MNNQTTEQEIQAKGLTAPRVTLDAIEAEISGEYYFTAEQGVQKAFAEQDELTRLTGMHGELRLLTFCVLRLRNGFTVTGESACASPENFDAEIARKIARQKAIEKVWPLLGFRLRDQAAEAGIRARNMDSHDMQLDGGSGITYCSRCGELAPGTKRSCAERLAALDRAGR